MQIRDLTKEIGYFSKVLLVATLFKTISAYVTISTRDPDGACCVYNAVTLRHTNDTTLNAAPLILLQITNSLS